MMYYIKCKWSDCWMYYKKPDWIVKDSPFYYPARFTYKEALKLATKFKDEDWQHEYELEEVR